MEYIELKKMRGKKPQIKTINPCTKVKIYRNKEKIYIDNLNNYLKSIKFTLSL